MLYVVAKYALVGPFVRNRSSDESRRFVPRVLMNQTKKTEPKSKLDGSRDRKSIHVHRVYVCIPQFEVDTFDQRIRLIELLGYAKSKRARHETPKRYLPSIMFPIQPSRTMKAVLFATLAGTAAAFAPESSSRASTAVKGAMEDLKGIAEKSNPVLKVRRISPVWYLPVGSHVSMFSA